MVSWWVLKDAVTLKLSLVSPHPITNENYLPFYRERFAAVY